jgi:hypothetical protein
MMGDFGLWNSSRRLVLAAAPIMFLDHELRGGRSCQPVDRQLQPVSLHLGDIYGTSGWGLVSCGWGWLGAQCCRAAPLSLLLRLKGTTSVRC